MTRYLLALYDDPSTFADVSPEEMQSILEKYGAWATGLEERGRCRPEVCRWSPAGRVLRSNGDGVRVLEGPYSETNEVLGGFVIVEAAGYDEAVELARECPHLEYGTIEVREIETL